MRKCKTKHCRKKPKKGRKVCSACRSRLYRKKNPIKSAYHNLKSNAKRRGKVMELTFQEFKKFAIDSGYMAGKGIEKDSLHIDRRDPEGGYTLDNIRVLTNTRNVKRHRKYLKFVAGPDGKPSEYYVESQNNTNDKEHEEAPF